MKAIRERVRYQLGAWLVLLFAASVLATGSGPAWAQTELLNEGFESYPLGTFPGSGGWGMHWNGAGDASQYVGNAFVASGSAALHSTGSSCWAAGLTHPVTVPKRVRFEAHVLLEEIVACGCTNTMVHLGPVNIAQGMTAGRIHFGCDGMVHAETQTGVTVPLAPYSAGTWYDVAAEYDYSAKRFDVYVNGARVGESLPILDDLTGRMPNEIVLGAAHGANPVAWFDDVSLREMEAPCVPPGSDLVAWWPGDRHPGDLAGNNYGGVNGNVTYGQGRVGQAFEFDGAAGNYVEAWSIPDFGADPFTVDFWMNSNDSGSNTYLLGKSLANGGQGWDMRLDAGTIRVVGVNGWGFNITSDPSITPGTWHHVALSATATEVQLWIDGVLEGTSPRSAISPTDNPFRMGFTTDYVGSGINGRLDEVDVYNRALSGAEITAIYEAGSAGKCKPAVFTLDAGLDHSCGIRADGSVACFGNNNNNQANPPSGRFKQVSSGSYFSCGVRADGTLACWGADNYGQTDPPGGTFQQVDLGFYHGCGVRTDGTVACWGWGTSGEASPPGGTFSEVRLGWQHSCGLRTDGTLACWGRNDLGQASPPAGTFTQLSAGGQSTCALDPGGAVTCWGRDAFAPGGTFSQITVGTQHKCGLQNNGGTVCVGGNVEGPGLPPWGGFLYLTSNDAYSCGARLDGTLLCWGKNDKGQAPRLALSPTTLPDPVPGVPYAETITVTGSAPAETPYTIDLAPGSGELPPGLDLTRTGDTTYELGGTPTTLGSYYVNLRATDSGPAFPMAAEQYYPLTVSGHTLSVSRNGAGSGTVTSSPSGIACGSTCDAVFGEGATVTLTATPDLNSTFDHWTGSCAPSGSVLMDEDKRCQAYFSVFTVTPSTVSPATVGNAYSETFHQSGGFGTMTWSLTGTLPAGLALDAATGVLAGTPTQAGSFPLTVTAVDERGGRARVSPTLTVDTQVITVGPSSLPSGTAGVPYAQTFTQTGGIGALTWSITGALPTGLSLGVATGVLSGTPTQSGSFPFTVTTTDAYDVSGSADYTLVIDPPAGPAATSTALTSTPNPSASGQAVTFTVTVTPGTATGTVTFRDGATSIGTGELSAGVASLVTASLSHGTRAITAEYPGDSLHQASTSDTLDQTVQPPPYALSIGDAEVVEGNSGTVTVNLTVTLSPASATTVTVDWATANGTATADSDFEAGSGSRTFLAGETTKTISLSVWGDTPIEGDETFVVDLSDASGAVIQDGQGQVTILNDDSATHALPFGVVDTPAEGATGVEGAIGVTGWALDDTGVLRVVLSRDPVAGEPAGSRIYIGDAVFVSGARPDVATAFPTYPSADRAGWGYMLLTNMLPNQGNGTFKLWLHARDREGQETLLGTRTITCSNSAASLPFGTLDTPGQGATAAGSAYVVFGWALTPQAGVIPTDGSTIWVYVDGVPLGHPVYNQYRSDIATLFPGYANSGGAVGYYVLNTTTLANEIHTIAWSVTDSLGRAQGIGSRYFQVAN